jgi:hypothetical protein
MDHSYAFGGNFFSQHRIWILEIWKDQFRKFRSGFAGRHNYLYGANGFY